MRELTPLQMKIEVEQQVQRLGANRRDALHDEEIEWHLNKAQDRIVSYRIKPDPQYPTKKFQIDAKYAADIQKLIVPNYRLTPIVEGDEYNCVYANLPSDLAYFVNDRSKVVGDCEEGFASAGELFTERVLVYSFTDSSLNEGPFYREIIITIGESPTTITTPGFISKKEKFSLIDYILNKWNSLGYAVYWEEFGSNYYPNSFLVVTTNIAPVPVLRIDGTTIASTAIDVQRTRYRKFSARESYPNRMIKGDFHHNALQGNYYDRTLPNSPISNIAKNKIFVFHTERFLISEILIDYIRKPRRISLPLNTSCELPGTVHEQICSVASEMILGIIEAPPYPLKVQENITRTE